MWILTNNNGCFGCDECDHKMCSATAEPCSLCRECDHYNAVRAIKGNELMGLSKETMFGVEYVRWEDVLKLIEK